MAHAAPPRLSELQGWLSRVWTTPEGLDAALKTDEGTQALRWISNAPPVATRTRLAVYSDAYFLRLLEALGADFPATKRFLGEENFRILVAEHLRRTPSTSPNISDLGETLAGTARGCASDLCRLEWAVLSSLYTDRLPPLDREVFAKVSVWDATRLVFDPTLRLLETSWPVHRLWDERFKAPSKTKLAKRRANLVVHRDEEWVRVRAPKAKEFSVLKDLTEGETVGRACVSSNASAKEIQAWFADWTASGLIKGVK